MATKTILSFLGFLNESPTAWHAVASLKKLFKEKGYEELKENQIWVVKPGGHYFVIRNGSALCAFVIPKKKALGFRIATSHTDSPALKLKPNAEYYKENMVMMGVEVYGAPLLTSWLNRDLGIAGRIVYLDSQGDRQEALVNLNDHPLVIPQLAIHLDRNVNEEGLKLNKQEHLSALAALDPSPEKKTGTYLEKILKEKVALTQLLATDLFLYPLEPARLVGYNEQMIASYRIDSLASVYASVEGLCAAEESSSIQLVAFTDHEEVGSSSAQGADSPFLSQVLERISIGLKLSREEYFCLLNQSLCASIDLGHALHPNYAERHDPRHSPLLGKGVITKFNAQQRYATDAYSSGIIAELCQRLKIPLQAFVSRNDIPCGSTVGPIQASLTGIPTVDIGCAQLSMHSSRELFSSDDYLAMCQLVKEFFKD